MQEYDPILTQGPSGAAIADYAAQAEVPVVRFVVGAAPASRAFCDHFSEIGCLQDPYNFVTGATNVCLHQWQDTS